MTQRFHTLTGLACSLLAIASAPAVWGILTLSVAGTYMDGGEQVAPAQAVPAIPAASVELAVAEAVPREEEPAGEETARP
jgi:hypothetical protein